MEPRSVPQRFPERKESAMRSFLLMIAATTMVTGTAFADPGKDESGKGKWRRDYGWEQDSRRDHDRARRVERIPRGHLPPPGECRVWDRGVPPGHQPPPYRC
jgi:hypothetical protein